MRWVKFGCIGVMTLGLMGCSGSILHYLPLDHSNHQVVIGNPNLSHQVSIQDSVTQRINGLLEVSVLILSHLSSPQFLQYQVYWYDSQGLALSKRTPAWHPFLLSDSAIKTLIITAPSFHAEQFHVVISPRAQSEFRDTKEINEK